MAGYVPNDWRIALMEATAGRTAIAGATLYMGLATAVPANIVTSTLANITEVGTAGYARAAVPAFSNPATVTSAGLVQIADPTQFAFGTLTADMTVAAPYAFLTSAQTGTSAPIRYIFEIVTPLKALAGEPLVIPANTLILE